MKKVEIMANNNQVITNMPIAVRLAETITIPDDSIGIVCPNAELVDSGVLMHGTPILTPGVYSTILFRKQYPTSYRITSMNGNADFRNMETPVSIGTVIIGKFE